VLPHNGFLCVALFASALSILAPSTYADDAYRSEIERFRQRREPGPDRSHTESTR